MRAFTIAFVVTLTAGYQLQASPVAYQKMKVGHTWAHVVTVNMSDNNVKVTAAISRQGRGSSERFSSIISRTRPKAAITGTFFDTRSLLPIGDIAVDGRLIHSGYLRAAICVSPDNKAAIADRPKGRASKWDGYETVVSGGISLVRSGKIALTPRSEGFRDQALFKPNRRTAVGVTQSGKLLMVAVNRNIYLKDLAHVMIKLGSRDAIALDGGSSSALYYSGKSLTCPARKLTNILMVYDDRDTYRQARNQLAPTVLMASARVLNPMENVNHSFRQSAKTGFYDRYPFTARMVYTAGLTPEAPVTREPRSGHIYMSAPVVSFSAQK